MDDRSWHVAAGVAQDPRGAWLAATAQRVRRTGAMGHFRSRLVGRARAGALSGAHDRRRHQLELGPFVESDATPFNRAVLWEYIEKNGRMVDVYTDRDSMLTLPRRKGEGEQERQAADRLTQLGRSLRELGIGSIGANSAQAKGRVERSHSTAQDRLVKQLRLAKACTLEEANLFLEKEYLAEWNECFARPVKDFPNQHRPLTEAQNLALFCATPRIASSPTTTRFPFPGSGIRSNPNKSKRACGGNACAWNCGWMGT